MLIVPIQTHIAAAHWLVYNIVIQTHTWLKSCALRMQAYVCAVGRLFAAAQNDAAQKQLLRQLSTEMGRLVECVKLVNVDCFKGLLEGQVDPEMAASVQMDRAFYERLTVGFLH